MTSSSKTNFGRQSLANWGLTLVIAMVITLSGCTRQYKQALNFSPDQTPCSPVLQKIEYPDLVEEECMDGNELLSSAPMTISSFQETAPWELTVEECVELALRNSKVLQKVGGAVVNAPQGTQTLFDQALIETQGNGVEAALSAFDAQLNSSFIYNRSERSFNNPFIGGGASSTTTNRGDYNFEISKPTASGATFAFRNQTNYNRSDQVVNLFGSSYDIVNTVEVRQPLARGRGTAINRIAGPNAVAGQYNGVLLARIRSDISLADFESAVRNLVRDVENNYWDLYFAYRDLDTKLAARESARATWDNRKLRFENGVGRPDDEAQARQQYFNFQSQVQDALTGVLNGQPGVLGAERNLRRLLGLNTSDGRVIRPISEPAVAPIAFDWDQSQVQAIGRRVEIRRQKWTVRQRELELVAAKALNQWRVDLVGNYGFRGFGDSLLGSFNQPNSSAIGELIDGDLDDWQVGIEVGGAIGNRQGHLAIRNAELNLKRERAILKEQQRQILHDLNAAFTEVDRSMENLKTSFNSRVAVQEELDPKRKRVNEGQDQVFFLLDAEQRAATAESSVHRAIVDYNKALLNYAVTSGTLLSRYNIALREGEWCREAQENAVRKGCLLEKRGFNQCDVDTCPVSYGAFNQNAPSLAQNMGYVGSEESIMSYPMESQGSIQQIDSIELDSPDSQPRDNRLEDLKGDLENSLESNSLESKTGKFNFNSPSRISAKYLQKLRSKSKQR
jgi:outer membrane protein TolC